MENVDCYSNFEVWFILLHPYSTINIDFFLRLGLMLDESITKTASLSEIIEGDRDPDWDIISGNLRLSFLKNLISSPTLGSGVAQWTKMEKIVCIIGNRCIRRARGKFFKTLWALF